MFVLAAPCWKGEVTAPPPLSAVDCRCVSVAAPPAGLACALQPCLGLVVCFSIEDALPCPGVEERRPFPFRSEAEGPEDFEAGEAAGRHLHGPVKVKGSSQHLLPSPSPTHPQSNPHPAALWPSCQQPAGL